MLPGEAPALGGMTRSASSDGLGFKVHYASRGGMKRHLSLMPVNVNGQGRHIAEEDEEFTCNKPLGRNNTFSVKNQSRCSRGMKTTQSYTIRERWAFFHTWDKRMHVFYDTFFSESDNGFICHLFFSDIQHFPTPVGK